MNVKYDVREIENSQGTGGQRKFVRPLLNDAKSRKQLSENISHSCSLTPADVDATLMALGEVMRDELSSGHRVYLPEIGYFSLKVRLEMPEGQDKVRGNYISVSNVKFKPEQSLLSHVRENVRFLRANNTMRSRKYTDEEMVSKMNVYMSEHRYVTRKLMEIDFHLTRAMALWWLSRLLELGVLKKEGSRNAPVYFLK